MNLKDDDVMKYKDSTGQNARDQQEQDYEKEAILWQKANPTRIKEREFWLIEELEKVVQWIESEPLISSLARYKKKTKKRETDRQIGEHILGLVGARFLRLFPVNVAFHLLTTRI